MASGGKCTAAMRFGRSLRVGAGLSTSSAARRVAGRAGSARQRYRPRGPGAARGTGWKGFACRTSSLNGMDGPSGTLPPQDLAFDPEDVETLFFVQARACSGSLERSCIRMPQGRRGLVSGSLGSWACRAGSTSNYVVLRFS